MICFFNHQRFSDRVNWIPALCHKQRDFWIILSRKVCLHKFFKEKEKKEKNFIFDSFSLLFLKFRICKFCGLKKNLSVVFEISSEVRFSGDDYLRRVALPRIPVHHSFIMLRVSFRICRVAVVVDIRSVWLKNCSMLARVERRWNVRRWMNSKMGKLTFPDEPISSFLFYVQDLSSRS